MFYPGSNRDGSEGRLLTVVLFAAALVLAGFPACSRADSIRLLSDDREAFQARVDLIQQAESQVDAAYFEISDDNMALAFLALLRDAARRGVRVRLLVDDMFNDIPPCVQDYLVQHGVEIREFHPVKLRQPLSINRRMHDKLLIVDACHLIIGSRNMDHRHFGLGCVNYVDRDAYVRGHAAHQAHSYFQCLWSSAEEGNVAKTRTREKCRQRNCNPMRSLSSRLEACRISPGAALDQALLQFAEGGFIHLHFAQGWLEEQNGQRCVDFLNDCVGAKREPCAITSEIHELFAKAQKSIIIESPYFVVSRELNRTLERAQARGVHVVILTNSLASTDQVIAYAGYSYQKRRLLNQGAELWEYVGPNHFHAKTALIDCCIAIIGSHNFDARSEHLDTQSAVVVRDAGVAEDLLDSMAENFAHARPSCSGCRPVGAMKRNPGADASQIREFRRARLVAPLIMRSL